MHLDRDISKNLLIKSIFDDYVIFGDKKYTFPICIINNEVNHSMNIAELIKSDVDIIIVGTGKAQKWPSKDQYKEFINSGKSIEYMNDNAAASTFNMLRVDNRNAACILGHI